MAFDGIENVEDRRAETVIRRKSSRTDDPEYPSGDRDALHHGVLDGGGVIRRDDNENRTPGRHERHTPEGVETIEFPGMMELRDRFINEVQSRP